MKTRLFVKFPVTRVHECSNRSLNMESDGIRDRVIDRERSHDKVLTDLYRLVADVLVHVGELVVDLPLLHLDELVGHRSGVEWSVFPELAHRVGDRPDVVDVTVGDRDSDYLTILEVRKIRDTARYSVLVLVRELESHIDHEDLVPVFKSHTVEADLLEPSEREDTEYACLEGLWTVLHDGNLSADRLLGSQEWECLAVTPVGREEVARSREEGILVSLEFCWFGVEVFPVAVATSVWFLYHKKKF